MMDDQNTDAMPVSKLFESADDFVIAGIAVRLTANLANFLHGIYDDEFAIGMLVYEEFKLFVKPISDFARCRCEIETAAVLHAVHHEHTVLDSLIIVLQRKIQHRSLMHFVIPQLFSCADVICNLRYQE